MTSTTNLEALIRALETTGEAEYLGHHVIKATGGGFDVKGDKITGHYDDVRTAHAAVRFQIANPAEAKYKAYERGWH